MYKYIFRGFTVACLLTAFVLQSAKPVYAATSISLYLSPSSKTVNKGENFSVQIRLNKNDSTFVEYIRANLTFPADKLAVNSVSAQGSYFRESSDYSGATYNNVTGFAGYESESDDLAKTGDFLVATVNFVAKNSGTANVTFSDSSAARFTSGGSNRLTSKSGGNYTVSSPAPPPATPSPGTASPPSATPPASPTRQGASSRLFNTSAQTVPMTIASNPSQPSTAVAQNPGAETEQNTNTAEFSITEVTVSEVTSSSAVVSWKTNSATTALINYGTSWDKLTSTQEITDYQTSFSVKLEKLPAGKTIYFEVTAINGLDQTSHSDSFKTKNASFFALLLKIAPFGIGALLLAAAAWFMYKKRSPARKKTPAHKPHVSKRPSPAEASAILAAAAKSHSEKERLKTDLPEPSAPAIEAPAHDLTAKPSDDSTKHWPWADNNQIQPATTPQSGSEPDFKNEPDIFELGEARLKEAEAAQAKKHLK